MKTKFFLNVYVTNQAYGGPEEGGWYYNVGEFVRCAGTFFNEEHARAERDALQAHIDKTENDPRGPYADRNSVLCEGEARVHIERFPGEDYPQSRPHYE